MSIRAVKKITARDVMGRNLQKIDVEVPVLNDDNTPVMTKDADGKDIPVMRKTKVVIEHDIYLLMGTTADYRVAKSAFGDSMVFNGNFEARRIEDGEIFVSTACIFPPIAADLAEAAFFREKAKDKDAVIEFAFVIGVSPDARGTEGFKFTCKPIRVGEAQSDPLAELKSSLGLNFAQVLGEEAMQRMALPMPGQAALTVDAETGEVKEPKNGAKAKADA